MPVFDINVPITVNADGTIEVGTATVVAPQVIIRITPPADAAETAREVSRHVKAV